MGGHCIMLDDDDPNELSIVDLGDADLPSHGVRSEKEARSEKGRPDGLVVADVYHDLDVSLRSISQLDFADELQTPLGRAPPKTGIEKGWDLKGEESHSGGKEDVSSLLYHYYTLVPFLNTKIYSPTLFVAGSVLLEMQDFLLEKKKDFVFARLTKCLLSELISYLHKCFDFVYASSE